MWAQAFVPPRYRRRRGTAVAEPAAAVEPSIPATDEEERTPVVVGVSGVNGATAIGARSRFLDRRKAGSSR
jgi:UDP-GlcNAc:undecaprenyl-phosphate GlcNAc-1-phosphate transferase